MRCTINSRPYEVLRKKIANWPIFVAKTWLDVLSSAESADGEPDSGRLNVLVRSAGGMICSVVHGRDVCFVWPQYSLVDSTNSHLIPSSFWITKGPHTLLIFNHMTSYY